MTSIGFDLDGVLYDWHRVVYSWTIENTKDLDISFEDFWLDYIRKDEHKMLAAFLTKVPIFVTNLIMSEPMRNMLWNLAKTNEIFYITARPQEVHFGTEWWIKTSKVPNPENLIFAKDKLPYIIEHDIDYFIEDMTKHAIALRKHTNVILVEKPWNTIIQDEFPTIHSVLELPKIMESL